MNRTKTGILTASELESGLKALISKEPAENGEVQHLISKHDREKQGGLGFEDFLRVHTLPLSLPTFSQVYSSSFSILQFELAD